MSSYERLLRLAELGNPTKKNTYTPNSLTRVDSYNHPGKSSIKSYNLTILEIEPSDDPAHPDYLILVGKSTSTTSRHLHDAYTIVSSQPDYHPHPAHMPGAARSVYFTSPTGCNAERWHYDPTAPAWTVITRDKSDHELARETFSNRDAADSAYGAEFETRAPMADRVTLYRGECKRAEKTRTTEAKDARTTAKREERYAKQNAEYLAMEEARLARVAAAAAEIQALAESIN